MDRKLKKKLVILRGNLVRDWKIVRFLEKEKKS
jgi:hypothetical protein